MDRRRKGFTLLELLAAITIVVVLAAMLAFGSRYALNSGKERTTRATLGTLQNMVAEYEVTGGKGKLTGGPYPVPDNVTADAIETWTDEEKKAVLLTRTYLAVLNRVSANAQALTNLPADQLASLTLNVEPPYGDWSTGVDYPVLTRVYYPAGGTIYIATRQHESLYNTDADPDPVDTDTLIPNRPDLAGAPWIAEQTDGPIVLDAWGNPILMGLPGGLAGTHREGVRAWQSGREYNPGDLVTITDGNDRQWDYECVRAHTASATNMPNPEDPTDHEWLNYWGGIGASRDRPFFASAGPDGDFVKADDNVYSFEN